MGLFGNLFKGKKEVDLPPFNLSQLLVDMHSHLIPGIDDGSRSMDETIAMLAKFESLGFKKVITTPHIMSDFYRNTPEIIKEGLETVRKTAKELNLSIQIDAAAEYYFDDALMKMIVDKKELLTFGERYLLFEFSMHDKPDHIEELYFELFTQQYKPVLAHFERYPYFHGSVKQAADWRAKGINIQVNLNSLSGHYGPHIRKQAELLIDEQMVDFVATDCHRMDHLMLLERSLPLKYMHKLEQLPLKNQALLLH